MQLNIISWNIRHFRQSKIDDFIHTLWEVCVWAHVVFIYEDHTGLGTKLAKALNDYEAKQGKPKLIWSGDELRTVDEYVAVIWRSPVAVSHNTGAESAFADLLSGERCPAVVDVRHGETVATVAAWHAYGPAKVSAKDLYQSILRTDFCDILIGDFNFQSFNKQLQPGMLDVSDSAFELVESLDFEVKPSMQLMDMGPIGKRSVRLQNVQTMQEVLPSNHRGSTTFTDTGVGRRTSGLDRCLVNTRHVGAVKLQVSIPNEFDEMAPLTDHMPLMLIFEVT